jgi:hypothetical protein
MSDYAISRLVSAVREVIVICHLWRSLGGPTQPARSLCTLVNLRAFVS